jgi:hypothetical protein
MSIERTEQSLIGKTKVETVQEGSEVLYPRGIWQIVKNMLPGNRRSTTGILVLSPDKIQKFEREYAPRLNFNSQELEGAQIGEITTGKFGLLRRQITYSWKLSEEQNNPQDH